MREIVSKDNRIFKESMNLQKKKYRDERGEYLIEGPNLLEEAVKCSQEIKTVFVSPEFDTDKLPGELTDRAFVLSRDLFMKLSETEKPQGVISVVKKAGESFRFRSDCDDSGGNFVVLDRLQDPGNIGTILRTADAAGYSLAIFMKGTADPYSAKVIRSAAGSLFRVPILNIDTPDELIDFVHSRNKTLISTAMEAEDAYYDVDLKNDVAIVIGNEGNGIDPYLQSKSDKRIRIPMEGSIESLNASICAGILMYERIRK